MENIKNSEKEYYSIDLIHILKTIWHHLWLVVLVGILGAGLTFSYAAFLITPTYSSSIMLYVNNSSLSLNDVGFSISSADLVASQKLVNTYNVLLKNRTTLERVIEEADVSYTWSQLNGMIKASSVEETEVMRITVTSSNPYEARDIANSIAVVLPQRVTEIVEGTSMEVVDSAVVNPHKVAPSITKYTLIGLLLGMILSIGILTIRALLDNTIHDEEYIVQNYQYPILAKIPDLLNSGNRRYSYKYKPKYGYKNNYNSYYQSEKLRRSGENKAEGVIVDGKEKE